MEMSEKQKIEQWDFVDNAIFGLITELNPTDTEIEWDMEHISAIREVLVDIYVNKLHLCSEDAIYP
jgi:hypothetical protein